MGTQFWFQRFIYLMLLFIVLRFPVRSVEICNPKVDESINQDITDSSPCTQKYLLKHYFEKHDKVLDLDLQELLAHKLPIGSCKDLPRNLSSVLRLFTSQQNLIGEGSHRRLFSTIKFNTEQETINELPTHFCQVIAVERLPTGVFADPFELQHLVQRGVFADAAVFGDTNLELPSALSDPSTVEIHIDVGTNVLWSQKKELEIGIELPLHARYPPLDRSGYSTVEIGIPYFFMHCSIEGMPQKESCLWMIPTNSTASKTWTVTWRIPSGNKAHSAIVSAVTYVSALLCSLLIVFTTIYHSSALNFESMKKQE